VSGKGTVALTREIGFLLQKVRGLRKKLPKIKEVTVMQEKANKHVFLIELLFKKNNQEE
jgi:hypothetical protein